MDTERVRHTQRQTDRRRLIGEPGKGETGEGGRVNGVGRQEEGQAGGPGKSRKT